MQQLHSVILLGLVMYWKKCQNSPTVLKVITGFCFYLNDSVVYYFVVFWSSKTHKVNFERKFV